MFRSLQIDKRIFSGHYANLGKIREFVIPIAEKMGFDDKELYAIELAVDEACSNIIEHAYGGEGRGNIECTLELCTDEIRINLLDHGKPFDITKVPEPKIDQPLEKRKIRGLGIYLMRKMMDEIRFQADPIEGNHLLLIKRKKGI